MARGINIYKRKDGRWEGRYPKRRKPDGSIFYGYVYGYKYKKVKEKLIELKANNSLKEASHNCNVVYSGTFKCWSLNWLNNLQNGSLKSSTKANYLNKIEVHLIPEFGSLPLEDISFERVDRWVKSIKETLKISSVNLIFGILKRCLEAAVSYGYLFENPCQKVKLPAINRAKMRALTRKEQVLLVTKCSNDSKFFPILFALETGLRIGEICGLKWVDISFKEKYIKVNRTRQRIALDSIKSKTLIIEDSPKTFASMRNIPLTNRALEILEKVNNEEICEYVFTFKGKPLEPRTLSRRFDKIVGQLNLKDVTFHSLRHTFATRCIELGANIPAISKLLGHSSIKLTLDTYTTPFYEEQIRAIDSLNDYTEKISHNHKI